MSADCNTAECADAYNKVIARIGECQAGECNTGAQHNDVKIAIVAFNNRVMAVAIVINKCIRTITAGQRVITGTAVDFVIAITAANTVVAALAKHAVIACAAMHIVVTATCGHKIVSGVRPENVIAFAAEYSNV